MLLEDDTGRAARYVRYLDRMQTIHDRKTYGSKICSITTHYLWGVPGTGKTRHIYDAYPVEDIYRVTDYTHPWDEYSGPNVLVLDEYDSQFTLERILTLLDAYPLMLPARYHNHQASFTIVWIISNEPLDQQYPEIQGERRQALTRRINENLHMLPGGVIAGKSHNESRENACAAKACIGYLIPDESDMYAPQVANFSFMPLMLRNYLPQ